MKPRYLALLVLALAFVLYAILAPKGLIGYFTHTKSTVSAGEEQGPSFPARIAFTPEGNLLVTDYNLGDVYTLSKVDRSVIDRFHVQGLPLAVAWGRGMIYIGNEQTQTIEAYNKGGKLVGTFKEWGNPNLNIIPLDMAIDEVSGFLYVVDNQDKNVKVFTLRGEFVSTIPSSANGDQLSNPTAIALDRERGEVLISDYGEDATRVLASVKVFSVDGQFRFKFISDWLEPQYRFSRPQGLALDSAGDIYLVDAMLGKVIVVDRNTLQAKAVFGGYGTGAGKLKLPLDIVVDNGGTMYVTDNRNSRIGVFTR